MVVEELHWSTLKHMAKSPAHLLAALTEPNEPTASMNGGTLIHAVTLGAGDFVVYAGRRAGKAWESFRDSHEGQNIVTQAELDRAKRAADAVHRHPLAAPLLVGEKERAWTATMYGRKCAGRIDVSGPNTVDLKSVANAEPGYLSRTCLRMGYHAQLDWYQSARRALGEDPGEAFIIGVESRAPYAVTVLRVTRRALLEGGKMNRLWLERLAACEAVDEWPSYVQSAVDLDIVEDAGLIFGGGDDNEAEVEAA